MVVLNALLLLVNLRNAMFCPMMKVCFDSNITRKKTPVFLKPVAAMALAYLPDIIETFQHEKHAVCPPVVYFCLGPRERYSWLTL
jgi:hypothetical protein